jgi:hypothetical protein
MPEMTMQKKLELMLSIYRERLEKASIQPIDFVEGIRCEAIIGVLENLYYYALQEQI